MYSVCLNRELYYDTHIVQTNTVSALKRINRVCIDCWLFGVIFLYNVLLLLLFNLINLLIKIAQTKQVLRKKFCTINNTITKGLLYIG